jgi:membrane fusion protein (multidrug efflux system)
MGWSWMNKNISFVSGLPTFKNKKAVEKQGLDEIAVPVKGYKIARMDFADTLPALGTVKGYREIELKFQETGYLEYVNFKDGEKAIEGDIIASLDQRAALLKLEYAKNELDRNQKLLDLGSIVQTKLQQVQLEYQSARLDYEKTNLIAPFDGYIGSLELQKGDLVTPNDLVGTFVNLTDAYIEFGIIEKDIEKVKVGQPAAMTVDSYPQDSFSGEIESISPIVEGRTRTFKVKARIINENEKLKAGMFGRVGIQIYENDNTIVIPSSAFRKKEQEYFVYVVHPEGGKAGGDAEGKAALQEMIEGTIEIRPIQIAYATPDAVEVKAGLDEEEIIVADIQQELEERARVEVTEIQEHLF